MSDNRLDAHNHIFISYSTKDKDYAYRLAESLREAGFDVWIDEARLHSSEDWWNAIVEALWSCGAFVVIMSPNSDASRWVQREVTIADQQSKPIFPLLLDGDINTPNWQIFVRTQFRDVRDGSLPPEEFYNKLAQIVTRHDKRGKNIMRGITIGETSKHDTTTPLPTYRNQRSRGKLTFAIVTLAVIVFAIGGIMLFMQAQANRTPVARSDVAQSVLRVYETASEESNALGFLNHNQQVTILAEDTSGEWFQIEFAGEVGWVNKNLLNGINNVAVPTITATPTESITSTPTSPPSATPTNAPTSTPTPTTEDIIVSIFNELNSLASFDYIMEQNGVAYGVTFRANGVEINNMLINDGYGSYIAPDTLEFNGELTSQDLSLNGPVVIRGNTVSLPSVVINDVTTLDSGSVFPDEALVRSFSDQIIIRDLGADLLPDGEPVNQYRLRGTWDALSVILAGLPAFPQNETVSVDLWVEPDSQLLRLIEVTLPNTATATEQATSYRIVLSQFVYLSD
ncbi:MAG: TIR domain-containing protein [Chloroflexota bacterium]